MATRFDHKGGFADHAAIRRKRREKTADKIDKIIDWQPIEEFLKKILATATMRWVIPLILLLACSRLSCYSPGTAYR
ncbi:hypothetical protein, partial [Dethiosulfatarculus sandiegensis]|uniref:hypothetical protein n=1 Tax=Dethiosulfatarculus sandiegensis TaxID=1429043 RepID=UPI0005C870E1